MSIIMKATTPATAIKINASTSRLFRMLPKVLFGIRPLFTCLGNIVTV